LSPTAPSDVPTLPQAFCIEASASKSPAIGLNSASSRLQPVSWSTAQSMELISNPHWSLRPSMYWPKPPPGRPPPTAELAS